MLNLISDRWCFGMLDYAGNQGERVRIKAESLLEGLCLRIARSHRSATAGSSLCYPENTTEIWIIRQRHLHVGNSRSLRRKLNTRQLTYLNYIFKLTYWYCFQGQILANLKAMDSDWFGREYLGRQTKVRMIVI